MPARRHSPPKPNRKDDRKLAFHISSAEAERYLAILAERRSVMALDLRAYVRSVIAEHDGKKP